MSGPLTAPQDTNLGIDLGTPGPRESRASQKHQSPRHLPWALRKRVKGLEPSTFTLAIASVQTRKHSKRLSALRIDIRVPMGVPFVSLVPPKVCTKSVPGWVPWPGYLTEYGHDPRPNPGTTNQRPPPAVRHRHPRQHPRRLRPNWCRPPSR